MTETKKKRPAHEAVQALIANRRATPEARLAVLALMYASAPLSTADVRTAAGLTDEDAMTALRLARSLRLVEWDGDRYTVRE
jgi:hypothetical protein